MKLIQELSENIDEEISDAIKYAKMALEYEEDYPALAEAVYKLSEEEMKHMNILHGQVTAIIDAYRKKNGEPPEAMKMLYDIMHRRQITHAAEAKAYQSMYKQQ